MIRPFRIGDETTLHDVFHSSIHTLTVDDYTPEQRAAWSPDARDAALVQRWVERMRDIRPFVMEIDGVVAGYADLQDDGHIDHFFVAGAQARQGVGTALMDHLIAAARTRGIRELESDVSITAQPFFRRFGFVLVESRMPVVRGVALPNAAMRLLLDAG